MSLCCFFIRVVAVVSHIQRTGCQPQKTTLHGGQSRSSSAEQGKYNKKRKSGSSTPLPPEHDFYLYLYMYLYEYEYDPSEGL